MAVSHVKSNIVADFTGTVTVFDNAGVSQTMAATDLVRPSDWNSAHNQFMTISGNTAGQSTFSGSNIVFGGGPNITISGVNATRFDISAGAGGAGDGVNILAAGTQTANTTGTVAFLDSNGIAWGMSNSSQITASYTQSTHSHSTAPSAIAAGTQTATSGTIVFVDSNGLAFGLSGSTQITGSYTQSTHGHSLSMFAVSNTTQSSSGTQNVANVSFAGAGAVSVGVTNGSVVVSAPNTVAQTNQTVGLYHVGNTTGQSSSSTVDARSISFDGAGIVSVGMSAGSVRISATQSNQAFSAGAASSTFQTLSFQDSNGLSFSNNAGAIRASYTRNVASNAIQVVGSATGSGTNTSRFAADDHVHAGVFSVGVSNVGNTAGDTRVDVGRFVLAGGANITLSQATAANALNTISIVAGAGGGETRLTAYAVSNTTQSSSGAIPLSQLSFAGAGIASVGVSNGSVIVSVPAGGGAGDGGVFAGVSTGGNTAGSTGTVSTGNLIFVGSHGVTLSQSTAGAGSHATITISGMQRTLSYYPYDPPVLNTTSCNSGTTAATGGSSQTTASLFIAPIRLEYAHEFTNVGGLISFNTAAGTGSWSGGHMLGIYSRTGNSISRVSSFCHQMLYSQNSVTAVSLHRFWGTNSAANSTSFGGNSSASITGGRLALLGTAAGSLSAGEYFVVHGYTHRTSGASVGAANTAYYISRQSYSVVQVMGVAGGANFTNIWADHIGAISVTSNGTTTGYNCLPDTIATTDFSGQTASANMRWFSPALFR